MVIVSMIVSLKYIRLVFFMQCISLFPDLLSDHPSPFGNLNCLNIEPSMRTDDYKIRMSNEARNFFLENCPSAKLIMAHLLEVLSSGCIIFITCRLSLFIVVMNFGCGDQS